MFLLQLGMVNICIKTVRFLGLLYILYNTSQEIIPQKFLIMLIQEKIKQYMRFGLFRDLFAQALGKCIVVKCNIVDTCITYSSAYILKRVLNCLLFLRLKTMIYLIRWDKRNFKHPIHKPQIMNNGVISFVCFIQCPHFQHTIFNKRIFHFSVIPHKQL